MTALVVVELPKEVEIIGPILGDRYTAVASAGHMHDLLSKEMGLEPSTFELSYEVAECDHSVLVKLKAVVKEANSVILATGPDREGEAISWYLIETPNPKNPQHVAPIAITKDKILAAFAEPRPFDMQRVYVQEARHALGHIIGHRVSPALSDATGRKIDAGRAQSSVVHLIVDLECTIAAFKFTQRYGAELVFTNEDAVSWKAQFDIRPHLTPGETYLLDDKPAKLAVATRNVTVAEYSDSGESKTPKAPFITSILQQAAGQRFKLKPKETMSIVQSLYDQGFVTYLHTGSPNIDDGGITNITAYAQSAGLPLVDKQQKQKTKGGIQEGHKVVRPTHVESLDCGADTAERALCRLIWQRVVVLQLTNAIYAVRTVHLVGNAKGTPVSFRVTGKTLVSLGQQVVYTGGTPDGDAEKDETSSSPIPALVMDDTLVASDGRLLTKKARPPARFKLPTLVMETEKLGIDRPSTYAVTPGDIITRGCTTEGRKGYLLPSSTDEVLRGSLVDWFKFIEFDYTRGLEDQLGQIAEGQAIYLDVVSSAWASLNTELATLESAALPITHPRPTCVKTLYRIESENGFFQACSDRECKTIPPDVKGEPGEQEAPPAPMGIAYPKCNKGLAHRVDTNKPIKRGVKPRPYDLYSYTDLLKCDAKYNMGADGKPVFGDDVPAAQEAS